MKLISCSIYFTLKSFSTISHHLFSNLLNSLFIRSLNPTHSEFLSFVLSFVLELRKSWWLPVSGLSRKFKNPQCWDRTCYVQLTLLKNCHYSFDLALLEANITNHMIRNAAVWPKYSIRLKKRNLTCHFSGN